MVFYVRNQFALFAKTIRALQASFGNLNQNKLLGRGASSGFGPSEEITLGTNLSLSGTTLNASGGGGSTPTGTGFRHITGGVEDGASKLVDTADINNNQVTNAILADMAQSTIKGRAISAGTGDPTDLTATQATAVLDVFNSTLKGLVPLSGGGTVNFLRADGTFNVPPGAGSALSVNGGSTIPTADLDNATPVPASGNSNIIWQNSGADISGAVNLANLLLKYQYKSGFIEDFISSGNITQRGCWTSEAVASGTFIVPSAGIIDGNHPGVMKIRSSTTTNSGWRFTSLGASGVATLRIGGGETFICIFNIVTLANLTIRFGFIDTISATDAVDGCYIEIPSTGAAVGKNSQNSTRTASSTIATLSVATWYTAIIQVNDAATSVQFTIFDASGTQLGTQAVATNIPTASGRETGTGFVATNVGVVATDLVHIDLIGAIWTKALVR